MNKYSIFMIMVLFLLFMTFVADSVAASTTVNIGENLPTGSDDSVSGIFRLLGTFFKILTFQLNGIPAVFNIFVFLPLTFGVVYMLIDIIKDLIPFT